MIPVEPVELKILEQTPALTRVAIKGQLDSMGVDQVGPRLNASMAREGHGIIELSEVTFLASLGIRLLISVAKMLDRRGCRLVLVAPRPLVEQALRHSALDEIIPVAADLEAARALARS